MFLVVGIMLLGVLCGYFARSKASASLIGRIVAVLIWALLFFLGVEVGGDSSVFNRLPSIGVLAVSLSMVCVLGSALLARLLWQWMKYKEKKGVDSER